MLFLSMLLALAGSLVSTATSASIPLESASGHVVEDQDLLATFTTSAGTRMVVAHAGRAWRGPGIRAHICVNGGDESFTGSKN